MQRKNCKNGLDRRFFWESSTLLLAALKTVTMPTMSQFPNLNTVRRRKGRPVPKLPNPKKEGESFSFRILIQSELFEIEDAACQTHTDTDPSAREEVRRGKAEIENSSEVSET